MNKITFRADYVGPYRTIRKKFADYESIEKMIDELTKLNKVLQEKVNTLTAELTTKIQSFQSVQGLDKDEALKKITEIQNEIKKLNNEIEDNKDKVSQLWYGYHERL